MWTITDESVFEFADMSCIVFECADTSLRFLESVFDFGDTAVHGPWPIDAARLGPDSAERGQ
jgi:hypothetical protein